MTDTPPPFTGPIIDQDDFTAAPAPTSAPGPGQRVVRSVKQAVLGLFAAVPASVFALTTAGVEVDPQIAAIAVGVPTACGLLFVAGWNLVDSIRGKG